ncbi:hypothetical protein AeRB84_016252 [Aphanomyces euteiches]|nr:hypothetical protein AeRB84_016252 [Aphanomyces euteiches]
MIKYRIPPDEVKIAMSSGLLDMLNVIEPDKVEKQGIKWVRRKIKESCDEGGLGYSKQKWSRFWKYFVKTWIHLYPPHLWTVHGVRMDAVARTNSPLERFNRELKSSFGTPHPLLPRFVQGYRRNISKICEASRGHSTWFSCASLETTPRESTKGSDS